MEQLKVVRTLQDLEQLEAYLKEYEFIAYDCETTGLDKDAQVIGFSVCADAGAAFYVVLLEWDAPLQKLVPLETLGGAKKFLQSLVGKSLIMHNAVFDCWKAETAFGVKLMPSVHTDTMILAHLLDENRRVGLKELSVSVFGDDSDKEQKEVKESAKNNGGVFTKEDYELYKADSNILGKYGAKDTLLTLKLFYHLVPLLYDSGLDKFFYQDESMPLLKGPTYEMNTTGLKLDMDGLQRLKGSLEADCMEAKAFIYNEIKEHVKEEYPGTSAVKTFNIGSSRQLAWLLFEKLGNEFNTLTDSGRELCKALDIKVPYFPAAKRQFMQLCKESKDRVYQGSKYNYKTKKMSKPKKIGDPWIYMACGKETLGMYADKYKWVARYLEYAKNKKLLSTYVEGIQSRSKYGVIRPSFLQHGTTSGRYSSRNPNFQNLPKGDKRVKSCIVARPGKVFVGADYSQLEPRVFASFSKDERLMKCFSSGDDFYSVIGAPTFNKTGLSMKKDTENSFAKKHPELRDKAKIVGLSATYGNTAFKMAKVLDSSVEEAQTIIDSYFSQFPSVLKYMLECHEKVKSVGYVENLFGRPRRIPEALKITGMYGNTVHAELPYSARNILNLSVNHPIQSTGASIMNRAAIAVYNMCRKAEESDPRWAEVKIIMQVHDELELEGPEELSNEIKGLLKHAMENTVVLPGVELVAEPKIGKNLAELK